MADNIAEVLIHKTEDPAEAAKKLGQAPKPVIIEGTPSDPKVSSHQRDYAREAQNLGQAPKPATVQNDPQV